MAFELAKLEYDYVALEPYIDARTMEIHHDKHHAGYTNNLNAAIAGTDLEGKSIEAILSKVSGYSVAVRNNGGGYYNHNLYWDVIAPGGSKNPEGNCSVQLMIHLVLLKIFRKHLSKLRLRGLDQVGHG